MSAALIAFAIAAASFAGENAEPQATAQDTFTNPCEAPVFKQFDMWVGDWVAFDAVTGVVQGIDRIEKVNNGCTIMQDWRQMTDRFRRQGAPYRYAGVSLSSVLPTGQWRQTWVGNGGFTVQVTGTLDDQGRMVLATNEFKLQDGRTARRVWHWAAQDDGTLLSWGEAQIKQEDGSWQFLQKTWDLRYVPRGDAPELKAAEAE